MTAKRAERKFPELNTKEMKYCSVFYEGIHDDARTNLAIAQTAAMKGADIVNYCEVISFLKEDPQDSNLITGAMVRDYQTKEVFPIYAKSILFCGGPFTDELRKLEDEKAKEAVTGASGIHIVLPNYYNPTGKKICSLPSPSLLSFPPSLPFLIPFSLLLFYLCHPHSPYLYLILSHLIL